MVEFQLEDVVRGETDKTFKQLPDRIMYGIFILNMDRKPNMVELFIFGLSMARMALSKVARQRWGQKVRTTTTDSCSDKPGN